MIRQITNKGEIPLKPTLLPSHDIPQAPVNHVLEIIKEYDIPLRSDKHRKLALVENLLIRTYLHSPAMTYAECMKAIQPLCQQYALDPPFIRRTAEDAEISDPAVRTDMAAWAYGTVELLYTGMTGDEQALEQSIAAAKAPYRAELNEMHPAQSRFLIHAMFEFIPELHSSEGYERLLNLGRKYCRICLSKSLDSIRFDFRQKPPAEDAELEALRREVYLAKHELAEYKELVDTSDAAFEKALEERKREEVFNFFRMLNDQKYGHIIDTVYLEHRACNDLRRKGEKLPPLLEGIPGLLERMLCFFKDSSISPAIRFPPNSVQRLTVREMEGCTFEPLLRRSAALTEDSVVKVRIISSGWRCGTYVISPPVLREEE